MTFRSQIGTRIVTSFCSKIVVFFILLTVLGSGVSFSYSDPLKVVFLAGAGGMGDESFNDNSYKGVARASRDYKFNLKIREWLPGLETSEQALVDILKKNPDIIVVNGNQYKTAVKKHASHYPHIRIIANDFAVLGLSNVTSIEYGQHEGAYLAGVLAGYMTRTGKIGIVAGADMPIIHCFRVGFTEGVANSSRETKVLIEYISNNADYLGYDNPEKGYHLGLSLIAQGVDVLFAVAGVSGNGVIQAGARKKKYVIGVDSDQDHLARGYVLTSVIKHMDKAIYSELSKVLTNSSKPGFSYYGLKEGGVSLSPMKYTRHKIPDHVHKEIEKIRQDIISGKIRVTNYRDGSDK